MDFLYVFFSVSSVKTYAFIPFFAGMLISFFTSMAGIAGAFLLLPFQMFFFNFSGPSASATNFIFNIIATPGGIYRYIKEGRMVWPLALTITIGTLPGIFIGYYIRIFYLSDTKSFSVFVGLVLLYISVIILHGVLFKKTDCEENISKQKKQQFISEKDLVVKTTQFNASKIEYEFCNKQYSFSTVSMISASLIIGIAGGAYGIGGGAMISPICIALFRLPVHTVAGASLLGAFLASAAGVIFYSTVPLQTDIQTAPDWPLGLIFGIGGLIGMYTGARLQKYVPEHIIKPVLGIFIFLIALRCILQVLL
ncbi:MAG: sulfite exporter TauE/SafE family protein [Nitrospiraceae bacterium]|nr:sulfite exporter TauE/SafE family protein [Nitrospiraceae bacterium]